MQAKDIPEEIILIVIKALHDVKGTCSTNDIYNCFQQHVPRKVIKVKLEKMIDKRIIDGCACGCYGGFYIV